MSSVLEVNARLKIYRYIDVYVSTHGVTPSPEWLVEFLEAKGELFLIDECMGSGARMDADA